MLVFEVQCDRYNMREQVVTIFRFRTRANLVVVCGDDEIAARSDIEFKNNNKSESSKEQNVWINNGRSRR